VMFRQGSRPATSVRSGTASVQPGTIEILYAYPRDRQLQIGVHLPTPGDATVTIADLLGRRIAQHQMTVVDRGVQMITVPLPRTLPEGVYLVSVVTPNGTQSRLIKIDP